MAGSAPDAPVIALSRVSFIGVPPAAVFCHVMGVKSGTVTLGHLS
jgi:hypothetical protein